MKSTTPCRYFAAGKCYNQHCPFAHTPPPVCRYFAEGKCTRANCSFLHVAPLVQPRPRPPTEPNFSSCPLLSHRHRLANEILRSQLSVVFAPLCAGVTSRLTQYLTWELHSNSASATTTVSLPILVVEPTVFAANFASFTLRKGFQEIFAGIINPPSIVIKHLEGASLQLGGAQDSSRDHSLVVTVTSLQGLLAADPLITTRYSVIIFDNCDHIEAIAMMMKKFPFSVDTAPTRVVASLVVVQSSVTTADCAALNSQRLDKIVDTLSPIVAQLGALPSCVIDLTNELTIPQHMRVAIETYRANQIGDCVKAPKPTDVIEAIERFSGAITTGNILVLLPTPCDVELCAAALRYSDSYRKKIMGAVRGSVSLHEGISPEDFFNLLSRGDHGVVIFCTNTMASRVWCFPSIELVIDSCVALIPAADPEPSSKFTHVMQAAEPFDAALRASLACGGRCVQLCAPTPVRAGREPAVVPNLALCQFLESTIASDEPGTLAPCECALAQAVSLLLRHDTFLSCFLAVKQSTSHCNSAATTTSGGSLMDRCLLDSTITCVDEDDVDADDNDGSSVIIDKEDPDDLAEQVHINDNDSNDDVSGDISKCILVWIRWREVSATRRQDAMSQSINLHAVELFDALWEGSYTTKFALPKNRVANHLKPVIGLLESRCARIFAPFGSQPSLGVVLGDGRLAKVSAMSHIRSRVGMASTECGDPQSPAALLAIRVIKDGDVVVVESIESCSDMTPVPPPSWRSIMCPPIGPRCHLALTSDPKLRSLAIVGDVGATTNSFELWTAAGESIVLDLVEDIKRRWEAAHPILSFPMHGGKVRAVFSPGGLQLEDICFVEEGAVLSVSTVKLFGGSYPAGSAVSAALSKLGICRADLLDAPLISKNVIHIGLKQMTRANAIEASVRHAFPGIKVKPFSSSSDGAIPMKVSATLSIAYGADLSLFKGINVHSAPVGHFQIEYSSFLHRKVESISGNKAWMFGDYLCCRPQPQEKSYSYYRSKGWTATTLNAGVAAVTLSSTRLLDALRQCRDVSVTTAKVTVDFSDKKLRPFVEQFLNGLQEPQRYKFEPTGTRVDIIAADKSERLRTSCIDSIVKVASDLRKALEPVRLPLAGLIGKAVAQYLQRNPALCNTTFPNVLLRFPHFDLKPHPTYTISCQGNALECQAVAKLCWDLYSQFTEHSRMIPLTNSIVRSVNGPAGSALRKEPTFAMDMMCALVGGIDAGSRDCVASLFSAVTRGLSNANEYCCSACRKAADVVIERCGHLACHDCIAQLVCGTTHNDPIRCPVPSCNALLSRLDVSDDSLFEALAFRQLAAVTSQQTEKGAFSSSTTTLLSKTRCCPYCLIGFLRLSAEQGGHAPCSVCPSTTCVKCLRSHVGGKCSDFDVARDSQSISRVLQQIFLDGEAYVRKDAACCGGLLERNPCLAKNSPAMMSFLAGLAKCGARSSGVFAWHGTPSIAGVQAICHGNLDVKRRSGQAHGPGEYFGVNPTVSLGYAKSTNAVILFYLLQTRLLKHIPTFCYVLNNPSQTELYCLPVFVLQLDKKSAPLLSPTCCDARPLGAFASERFFDEATYPFRFRWDANTTSRQMTEYSDWATQRTLNTVWDDLSVTKVIVKICRDCDRVLEDYEIDFAAMTQRNLKTNFTRRIDRICCLSSTLGASRTFQYKTDSTTEQALLFSREEQEVLKGLYSTYLARPPNDRSTIAPITARLTVVTSERKTKTEAMFQIHFGSMTMQAEGSERTVRLFLG